MSKIIKQRWGIVNPFDLNIFNIGQEILPEDYANFNLVNSEDGTLEYVGKEDYLWKIILKNNLVKEIYYKQNCPFPNINFWDDHFDKITLSLSKKYKLLTDNESFKGIVLYIVYRDYFVALIGILET
jgi:hypothetical protein